MFFDHLLMSIFGQLLLPLFVVALLFGIAGVSPELVIRSAASVVVALISGIAKLILTACFPPKNGHGRGDREPAPKKRPSVRLYYPSGRTYEHLDE